MDIDNYTIYTWLKESAQSMKRNPLGKDDQITDKDKRRKCFYQYSKPSHLIEGVRKYTLPRIFSGKLKLRIAVPFFKVVPGVDVCLYYVL